MKVLLDIPEEFEIDYRTDRFGDFFKRAKADMSAICGRYERETADVLAKAFEESRVYDPDKVVEQLEENCNNGEKYCLENRENCNLYSHCDQCAFKSAIRIVKGGGVDG